MALQLPPVFTTLQVPLIMLTNITALAIGPRHRVLQFAFSVPVLIVLVAQSLYREWDGGWGLHYGLNCFVMSLVMDWVDWVLLNSPYREGWTKLEVRKGAVKEEGGVVRKEQGNGYASSNGNLKSNGHASNGHASNGHASNGHAKSNGHATSMSKDDAPKRFWSRFWWATRLTTTNRYPGWSCESKNVPVEVGPEYSRLLFIARKTLRAGLFYALRDVVYSFTASSPHGTWLDIAHIDPVVSFDQYPFLYRLKYTWVYIVLTYVSVEFANTLYGIASVATGLAVPMDCPSMFGDLKELYSVRRAWSLVWHQGVRRVCSAPGIYLARDVLQLSKGSFASKYLQLFVAFCMSAFMHSAASMLCHASLNDDQAMQVFVYQAVIIFVEDHLIDFGKKCGLRDSVFWRLVGFCWVVLVVGASFESWTGRLLSHGLWVHDRESDFFGIGPK
ncbi:hypothetical protein OPT61_g9497 [Boeremia exigua]|uniref:Uncharacterized protein n=1 Tax=Boeremia exigua TaxID=749465 RepID=A0ACC2HU65_9PLEO|nr:hypothetical protein OPT61_g9497 [Boeremia exigua]